MANDEDTNPPSPTSSTSSASSSRSSTAIPEALVHGREKRATAGNKLRALLDAEFQEEEIFKEDENDEEFERQKSEEGEDFLTDSESSDNEEIQDEEEGERALLAQQKSEAKKSRERKRKANEAFSKPAAKRRVPPTKENVVISKAASTASSVSNRRISFDPTLLSSRRSSRALTVQTTNETHSRIISAAARRATLPVIPRREQTPPLTQEERLAQAVLTEQENKLSLKRIVEAEEERARKRREKLEALRRRRFDSPILRFISRRQPLIEEIPADEDIVVVDDVDEKVETQGEIEVKQEPMDGVIGEVAKDKQEAKEGDELVTDIPNDQGPDTNLDKSAPGQGITNNHEAKNTTAGSADTPPTAQSKQQSPVSDGNKSVNPPALAEEKMDNDLVNSNNPEPAKTITDKSATPVPPQTNPSTSDIQQRSDSMQDIKTNDEAEVKTISPTANGTGAPEIMKDANEVSRPTESLSETHLHESRIDHTTPPPAISPSTPKSSPKTTQPQTPPPPKSPPPYHEANYTANTLSFVPLPGAPLYSTRETFFPDVPVIPPPKPKPSARCPITGLPARYKDPLSGVGYYDIHAFKILREVGRKGGRYVWCSEGGWFVGETGWGGRAAKGVPEGWNT